MPADNLPEVDIYCERIAYGFFNEPLNLISNIFFVIAGILIIKNYKISVCEKPMIIFGSLVISVGLGSFLFHGFATHFTMAVDIIAIAVCVFYVIYIYLDQLLSFCLKKIILIYGVLIVLSLIIPMIISSEVTNGSSSYFGILLIILLIYFLDHNQKAKVITLQVFVLFAISLLIRSIDMSICSYIPVGVHYLWHALNALLLYRLSFRFDQALNVSPE